MKKRGKRSCTEVVCALTLVVAGAAAAPEDARGGDSFLLPGVALSDAEFVTGSWCRYLVVDEIMGALDTTTVYIAVTGEGRAQGVVAYWLEIDSGPAGTAPSDRQTAKALISSDINRLEPGDSLCQYISELYIKRGSGAVEPADPADLEQLTLSHPTSDSDWVLSPGVTLQTPQGRLLCDRKHLVVEDKREIPMGRVTLIKNDSDVYDVWFCEDVPIFRVAKCVIERLRDSRTVPSVPGIPNKEREESRTTVELVGFGSDAVERIRISK
jgi:hypothetical protein